MKLNGTLCVAIPKLARKLLAITIHGYYKEARVFALTHHEKWDGSGYPYQLKGEGIPLVGRIVALVDVFDALTSERPYKKAWKVEDALAHLQKESGKHFDPELVPLFLEVMPEVIRIMQRWSEDANNYGNAE